MRLTGHQIDVLAYEIVKGLLESGKIRLDQKDIPRAEEHLRTVITAELRIEDALNDEVRQILDPYLREMKAADASYSEMFKKVKAKLARERKIVL